MTSLYLKAGSPQACFLPSCRKPFESRCVHGDDGHYYCSEECADVATTIDLTHVAPLRRVKS